MENKVDYYKVAVDIQNASNIIAVTGELRSCMIDERTNGINPNKSAPVMAIFFKLYDMMGAPDTTEMYKALKACEQTISDKKVI